MKRAKSVILCCILWCFTTGCKTSGDIYVETAESREDSIEVQETEDAAAGQETSEAADCYVYVCGEVKYPGVYCLEAGSRIYEAVALAGGMTEAANGECINQAEPVADGMMVRIQSKEESAVIRQEEEQAEDGKLDLNTATIAELMTLPGIGEAKAGSILAYREANGGFSSVEEIMQVDGIKEGVYNRIKDSVTVR